MLIGEYDFSQYSKASSDTENKVCKIYESIWIFDDSKFEFKIIGDRFLQHMVRLLVGTMVEVARNHMSVNDFSKILHGKKTRFDAVRAPAKGLFLNKIYYV